MPVAVQAARKSNSNTKVISLAGVVYVLIFILILPSLGGSLVNFTGKYISFDKFLNFVNLNFIGHIDAEN